MTETPEIICWCIFVDPVKKVVRYRAINTSGKKEKKG
jgi:hypothetical protein